MNETSTVLPTKDELSNLIAPMVVKTKRFARNLSLWLVSPGAVMALFMLFAKLDDPNFDDWDASTRIVMACVMLFYCGVLPALAARWLVMRDLKRVRSLVRDGDIYPARVVRRVLRSLVGGASHLEVSWHDSQREQLAYFDVDARQLEDQIAPGTCIVAKRRRRQVLAYINGKLFVARRAGSNRSFGRPIRLA